MYISWETCTHAEKILTYLRNNPSIKLENNVTKKNRNKHHIISYTNLNEPFTAKLRVHDEVRSFKVIIFSTMLFT